MAVVVGGAGFHPWRFLTALAAMLLLHAGANILNDLVDLRKGLDTTITPGSGAVVRGLITTREALAAAIVLFSLGSFLGVLLALQVGWPLLAIGAVGVAIGVCYSVGPGLKYRALGDVAVFFDFGMLGTVGAWTVQTGTPAWTPAAWSIPMSLLVIGILHANNWRDVAGDADKSVRTVASILGDRGSLFYYGFLIFAPYAIVLAMIAATRWWALGPVMPVTMGLTLLALPWSVRLWKRALRRADPAHPLDFVGLDAATGQLSLIFGLLCTVGVLASSVVARWLS